MNDIESRVPQQPKKVDTAYQSDESDIDDGGCCDFHLQRYCSSFACRLATSLSILVAGIVAACCTYRYLRNAEQEQFEQSFHEVAEIIAQAAENHQLNVLQTSSDFGVTMTTTARSMNAEWPKFTLPYFELFAQSDLEAAGIEMIGVANIVQANATDAYLKYAAQNYESWMVQGHNLRYAGLDNLDETSYHNYIWQKSAGNGSVVPAKGRDLYFPLWTTYPPPINYFSINWDFGSIPEYSLALSLLASGKASHLFTKALPLSAESDAEKETHNKLHSISDQDAVVNPHSFLFTPVWLKLQSDAAVVVAVVFSAIAWDRPLLNLLDDSIASIDVVFRNTCGQVFSYRVVGKDASFKGYMDYHNKAFDDLSVSLLLQPLEISVPLSSDELCFYSMNIYPTSAFESDSTSSIPGVMSAIVAGIFLFFLLAFLFYDESVHRKMQQQSKPRKVSFGQSSSQSSVEKQIHSMPTGPTSSSVSEMYISSVADNTQPLDITSPSDMYMSSVAENTQQLDITSPTDRTSSEPEIYMTVLVAAVHGLLPSAANSGFLQKVRYSFRTVANNYSKIKVDYLRDRFIASTRDSSNDGKDALTICNFAVEWSKHVEVLIAEAGDEAQGAVLRIGIHSGTEDPSGDFFGETTQNAVWLELACEPGRILVSDTIFETVKSRCEETGSIRPDLLDVHREDAIVSFRTALEFSELTEFTTDNTPENERNIAFCKENTRSIEESCLEEPNVPSEMLFPPNVFEDQLNPPQEKQVDHVYEELAVILLHVVSRNSAEQAPDDIANLEDEDLLEMPCPVEEINDIIPFSIRGKIESGDHGSIYTLKVSETVLSQLRDLLSCIEDKHNPNPFHNFQHSCNAALCAISLLHEWQKPSRETVIASEGDIARKIGKSLTKRFMKSLRETKLDPLAQFAVVFACLIQNMAHAGMPNAQIIDTDDELASKYKRKSVSQQNALEKGWALFMDDRFQDLRQSMFASTDDLRFFRAIVVNGVLATDVESRHRRKYQAIARNSESRAYVRDTLDRELTTLVESLIEAAHVWYTLDTWEVYIKWNQLQFKEMLSVHERGLADANPSDFWVRGETFFFDDYVIPLMEKLQVYGLRTEDSGLHYVDRVMSHRHQWAKRGSVIVVAMKETSRNSRPVFS